MQRTTLSIFLSLLTTTISIAASSDSSHTFKMSFGSFTGDYKFVTPKGNSKVKIAYIPDFSDNYAMGIEAAKALADKIPEGQLKQIEAVVVPGDKANMLGTLLYQEVASKRTANGFGDTTFAIFRSSEKGAIASSVKYGSVTGGNKVLHIRPDQVERLQGKKILLFDDVISSGGTIKAAKELSEGYKCSVVAFSCVATEDVERSSFEGKPLYALTHLPVLVDQHTE